MKERGWLVCRDPAKMLAELGGRDLRKSRLFAAACCRRVWGSLPDDSSRQAVAVAERYADGRAGEAEKAAASQAAGEAFVEFGTRVDFEVSRAGLPEGGWCDWGNLLDLRGLPPSERPFDAAASAARQAAQVAGPVDLPAASVLATAALAAYLAISPERGNGMTADRAAASSVFFATTTKKTCHYQRGGRCDPAERASQCDLIRDIFGNPFRARTIEPAWRTTAVTGLTHSICDDGTYDLLPILADALQDAGCVDAEIIAHCRGRGPHVRGCWVVDALLATE